MTTLIVLAKAPVSGRVKTRLTPPFTPAESAALAEAALADTLETVLHSASAPPVLALDGDPGDWLPHGFTVIPQVGGGLDARIAGAFAAVAERTPDVRPPGPTLLIGMDTPQITPTMLEPDWTGTDALLGPALDGGFWALGFRHPDPVTVRHAVIGVPMSRRNTGAAQLARLRAAGLRTRLLPVARDVDTATDAFAIARLCAESRFARLLHETALSRHRWRARQETAAG